LQIQKEMPQENGACFEVVGVAEISATTENDLDNPEKQPDQEKYGRETVRWISNFNRI